MYNFHSKFTCKWMYPCVPRLGSFKQEGASLVLKKVSFTNLIGDRRARNNRISVKKHAIQNPMTETIQYRIQNTKLAIVPICGCQKSKPETGLWFSTHLWVKHLTKIWSFRSTVAQLGGAIKTASSNQDRSSDCWVWVKHLLSELHTNSVRVCASPTPKYFQSGRCINLSECMWCGCRRVDPVVSQAYPGMLRYVLAFLRLRQPSSLLHLGKRGFG